jgi:hypothetical protein
MAEPDSDWFAGVIGQDRESFDDLRSGAIDPVCVSQILLRIADNSRVATIRM